MQAAADEQCPSQRQIGRDSRPTEYAGERQVGGKTGVDPPHRRQRQRPERRILRLEGLSGKAGDSIAGARGERPGALEVDRVVLEAPQQRHVRGLPQQSQRRRKRQQEQEGRRHERPGFAAAGEESHLFAGARLHAGPAGTPGNRRRGAPEFRIQATARLPGPATSSLVKHVCPRAVLSGNGCATQE